MSKITTDLVNEARALEKAAEQLRKKAEQAAHLPDEPPEGSVIKWDQIFRSTPGKTYEFAAIRHGMVWYLTGLLGGENKNQIVPSRGDYPRLAYHTSASALESSTGLRQMWWDELIDRIGPENWKSIMVVYKAMPDEPFHDI